VNVAGTRNLKKKEKETGDISSKWHPKPTPIIFGSHAREADLIKVSGKGRGRRKEREREREGRSD